MSGIGPINERLMKPNFNFALAFRQGFLFGRTIRAQNKFFRPYPVIDSSGNNVEIAASSSQAALRFRDPRNTENDLLFLDTRTHGGFPWFLHGGIGIRPEKVRLYLRIPEGQDIPGKFPDADPIRPGSGDDMGYLDSLNSPYYEPTDQFEVVVPPMTHIAAEYYNDGDLTQQPVLNLQFKLYWVQFYDPENARGRVMIRKIATGEAPAAFLEVGVGHTLIDYNEALKKEWGVAAMELWEAME